jgi:FHA domain
VYSARGGRGSSGFGNILHAAFQLLVLSGLVFPALTLGSEVGISLLVEPGFSSGEKDWLVPLILVDDAGKPIELPADDMSVSLDGTPIGDVTVGYFAPEPGGFPSSSAVLVDRGFPGEGIGPLAGFLDSGTTDARRGLFRCGDRMTVIQKLGQKGHSETDLRAGLAGDEPTRLWDCILQAITSLGREGRVRKVLMIVSDGNEGIPSEHPLATCIEAAIRTRVAVHVLELGGDLNNLSRLRKLARQTGGQSITYTNIGSFGQSFSRMDGVRALRIPQQDHPLPAELAISFGFSAEVTGTAQVADQKALTGSGIVLILGLGFGVLVVVGGAVVLLRKNRQKVGVLLVDFQGSKKEVAIPPSGVAMGSDNDNQLVLDDQRISRHHAVIRVKAGQVILTDLRSKNGTLVNGQPIRNVSLHHGDKILLGKAAELTFAMQH